MGANICLGCRFIGKGECLHADKTGVYLVSCNKYTPKTKNKTCPTCKHGRASNEASLAFDGVPFLCSSSEPVTISHSEYCVTCDGWEENPVTLTASVRKVKSMPDLGIELRIMKNLGRFWFGAFDDDSDISWQEIPKYLYDALIRFEGENNAK